MNVIIAICCVMVSCSINVMILEQQIKADSTSANLITFSQFFFNSFVSFFVAMDFGRRKPVIPIRRYIFLTVMFFGQSLANNLALSYEISMPVHMIIKSGSLVASMVLGVLILQKKYSLAKWISISLVTIGIIICTWASAEQKMNAKKGSFHMEDDLAKSIEREGIIRWLTGVGLVVLSVFVAAAMGIYQETLFRRYGRHAQEGIFFSHALPLPGFLLLWSDLAHHIHIFNASTPVPVGLGGVQFPVPALWLLLLANVVTQYMCSASVFTLITISDSLTVTLVITLRKFLSLFISIIWFNNPFTKLHWIGTVFVILGTFLYIDIPAMRRQVKSKTA